MRYIIYQEGEIPFFTFVFIPENHYLFGMVVFDLLRNKYTTDGYKWVNVEIDSY